MNLFYGKNGKPVGSSEGEWLYDETGKLVGIIHEQILRTADFSHVLGYVIGSSAYRPDGSLAAVGSKPKRHKLMPSPPRIMSGPPRLISAAGSRIETHPTINLPADFEEEDLVGTLSELVSEL